MKIIGIKKIQKEFLDLLLLGYEEKIMIDKYLEKEKLFALYNEDLKTISVLESLKDNYEIKNIATYLKYQNRGYGTKIINS